MQGPGGQVESAVRDVVAARETARVAGLLEQIKLARAGYVAGANGLTAHDRVVAAELPESDAAQAVQLQSESTQQWDIPALLDDLEDLGRTMAHTTRRSNAT